MLHHSALQILNSDWSGVLIRLALVKVTVENFLRVLTGRLPASTPRSKRLLSDDRSNILIYLTGDEPIKLVFHLRNKTKGPPLE